MRIRMLSLSAALLWLVSAGLSQNPRITNATLHEIPAAGALKPTFQGIMQQQDAPAWIGYRIPAQRKERSMCCFASSDRVESGSQCCQGCKLESGEDSFRGASDCQPLEPADYVFLLFRIEGRQIKKIRQFSPDCPLDAGGRSVYWIQDASPAQSIEMLGEIAAGATEDEIRSERGLARQAVTAIAFHDVPSADQTLEKLIQPNLPAYVREQVAFWLGEERGKKGLEILRKYVKADSSDRFRERAVIGFAQSKEPEALVDLVSLGRNDPSPRVRKQAIFWLAQAGGRKEAEHITEAIENDPDTEVKKHAVFALSQLPPSDAVPLLIHIATTNKNAVVRKQAVFWLGQTHDPRALDFLEQLLLR